MLGMILANLYALDLVFFKSFFMIWSERKHLKRKDISTHPHPARRKNTQIVYRVYKQKALEAKENISFHIIIE